MSEGLKDTISSKEKKEKLGKERISDKVFYNGLDEAIKSRNREEAEKTEKIFKAISGTEIRTIRRQEELSEERETITNEETEKLNIVPICKKDITKTGNKSDEPVREESSDIRELSEERKSSSTNNDKKEMLKKGKDQEIIREKGETENLIKSLTEDLKNLVPEDKLIDGQLSKKDLSLLLGRHEDFISAVLYRAKKNPAYRIKLETLKTFKKNLEKIFGEKSKEAIRYIEDYKELISSKDPRRILINSIIDSLDKFGHKIVSTRRLSDILLNNPDYFKTNFFKKETERSDISTLFFIEYHISCLSEKDLNINIKDLEEFKQESINYIRDYLFEYKYIHEKALVEFNLIWKLFYAFSGSSQSKITSGDISRQILSGHHGYIARKLKDGTTIRSDTIDNIKKIIESLPPSGSKKEALNYLNYYLQVRHFKDSPTHYHYNWDKLFFNHCYDLLILQSGIDIFTGNPLPDDSRDLIRHHYYYDKSSIDLKDLTLMTKTSHLQYSHPTRMGKSKDPKGDKEKILVARSSISRNIPIKPKHWTNLQWVEYLKRRDYFENNGEYNFFRKFYPRFYNECQSYFKQKRPRKNKESLRKWIQ